MDTETYGKIRDYIDHHPVATLGTVNADGSPHGAIVYVYAGTRQPVIYFITKHDTNKYQNLQERPRVSVTVVDPSENSTLQADGRAFTVQDPGVIDMVMKRAARAHASSKELLPPIAKLRAGAYEVVGIELAQGRLAHFQGMPIGDKHIFTGNEG